MDFHAYAVVYMGLKIDQHINGRKTVEELPETPFLAQDISELQIFEGWKMILEEPYYAFDQFLYLFQWHFLLTLSETSSLVRLTFCLIQHVYFYEV